MANHEIVKLEQLINSVKSAQSNFNSADEWEELWRIVHQPGWTTIAEATLVLNTVESIKTQMIQLNALRNGLLAGARLVGTSQAVSA